MCVCVGEWLVIEKSFVVKVCDGKVGLHKYVKGQTWLQRYLPWVKILLEDKIRYGKHKEILELSRTQTMVVGGFALAIQIWWCMV